MTKHEWRENVEKEKRDYGSRDDFDYVEIFVFLRFGGVWLVEEDEIEDLDDAVIVLLMGSVGDRAGSG